MVVFAIPTSCKIILQFQNSSRLSTFSKTCRYYTPLL
nr:MAG TPA: hypothetical protein [Caudoviricetes sp.]